MPADDVIRQRRSRLVGIDDFPIRNKPQFYEGLKSVADARHQPRTPVKKLACRLLHAGIAEKGGDEFSRSVRLISTGEAARNENNLGLRDFFRQTARPNGRFPPPSDC